MARKTIFTHIWYLLVNDACRFNGTMSGGEVGGGRVHLQVCVCVAEKQTSLVKGKKEGLRGCCLLFALGEGKKLNHLSV